MISENKCFPPGSSSVVRRLNFLSTSSTIFYLWNSKAPSLSPPLHLSILLLLCFLLLNMPMSHTDTEISGCLSICVLWKAPTYEDINWDHVRLSIVWKTFNSHLWFNLEHARTHMHTLPSCEDREVGELCCILVFLTQSGLCPDYKKTLKEALKIINLWQNQLLFGVHTCWTGKDVLMSFVIH